jgi:hypothetical protein
MKLNNRSIVWMLISAIVIGAGLVIVIAATADRGTLRSGGTMSRHSHTGGAATEDRSSALYELLPRLLGGHDSIISETAGSKVDAGLRNRNRLTVNRIDIAEKASQVRLPYKSEAGRQDVLRRLEETGRFFEETISSVEKRIAEARSAGSRTPEEIAEAEEALADLKEGKRFIADRIKLVEKNPKQTGYGEGSE